MKRILSLTIIVAIACLVLSGCDIIFGFTLGHVCDYSEWEVTKDPTCTERGEEERYCLECFDTQTRYTKLADHTPEDFEGLAATCTKEGKTAGQYCSECMLILSGIQSIKPFGHTEVIDPAVPMTDNAPGRTEGKHCSTCGEILVKQMSVFSGEYSDADRYHGDYAYESLLTQASSNAMRDFYLEIDAAASDFHNSLNDAKTKEISGNTIYYAAEIYFDDNGLEKTEAITTWSAYVKDHPLYYWMSGGISYTDTYISIIVDESYADGETREEINGDIYKTVEQYILSLGGEADVYGITLGFHDEIIKNADYAYEADGVTPSIEKNAHNIIGVLLDGEGVCESYAKAFQLLLNYVGVENVYVTGYSGEPHAWNLVQLDDGEWYWYDLTWDDQPSRMLGVRHNYFCVTDDTLVNWSDGSSSRHTAFTEDHTPDAPGGVGAEYNYALPDRAEKPYEYSGLAIRDEIVEKDGLSYVLIGFKTLALIKIEAEGDVVIPEALSYQGDTYSVGCIGKYDADSRVLTTGSIIEYDSFTRDHIDVTSVSIPSATQHIWDFAFDNCYTIEHFEVSSDNKYFTSVDGVLFTKTLYTLVKYPLAKEQSTYTVPTETVEVAFNAFGDGGNVFCPEHLEGLTIPATVEIIGATGGAKGFRDGAPEKTSDATMIIGYTTRLIAMLGFGLTIE